MDIGPSGSAFFLRYRSNNFGLCTLHQLGSKALGFDPKAFTLAIDDADGRKLGLSPNETNIPTFPNGDEGKSLDDLMIARFDNIRNGRDIRRHFLQLDLRETLVSVPSAQVELIVAIGYPTEATDTLFKYEEDEGLEIVSGADYKIRWVKLYLELTHRSLHDKSGHRLLLAMNSKYELELNSPDGLSGSPVFFVHKDGLSQVHLNFAGLITHSDGHTFYIYGTDMIRQLLDKIIDD